MDVVLFHPAPRSGWQHHRRVDHPLGLLFCASPLVRRGLRVAIIDAFADRHWRAKLRAALAERPLCFGVSCMTGPQILHALGACELVRRRHPDVPIVWGGIHPSLLPEQTLQHPLVDVVVVGEGEATLDELVQAFADGRDLDEVAGIAYMRDGHYRYTGERPFVELDDQVPLPWYLVGMDRYRRKVFCVDHVSLHTSRGCPYRCAFCWEGAFHNRRFRAMRASTVLEQIRRIHRDYGMRGFSLSDDNFCVDMRRARAILEGVVREGLDLSICVLKVRADMICRMKPELLELMVRAGVRRVMVGAESGCPRVLKLIRKDITPEQIVEANRRLADYPIVPIYTFLMGVPTETVEEFRQSVRLGERITEDNPRAVRSFNIYTPYPGTELFDRVVQMGFQPPQRLEDWPQLNYRNLPRQSPWVLPETKKLITALDFPLNATPRSNMMASYKSMPRFVRWMVGAYQRIGRYRIRHLDGRFPVESALVKALGLFGRQD